MRIGTSKEFQFATRKKDPEPRSMEMLYGFLLIGPLVLAACSLGIIGWKKVNARTNHTEHMAPNPFPKRKAWAQAEQDKLRLNHSVKQIGSQRALALGTLDGCATDNRIVDIETPNFSGNRKLALANLIEDMQAAEKKTRAAIQDIDRKGRKVSVAPVDDDDDINDQQVDRSTSRLSLKRSTSRLTAIHGNWRAAKGMLSRVSGRAKRSSTAESIVEVRGIQEPASPRSPGSPGSPSRRYDPWAEEPPSPASPRQSRRRAQDSRVGADGWREGREPVRQTSPEIVGGGLGPISPTAQWKYDWDEEDDGPMPPSMEFSCNSVEGAARR